MTAGWRGNQPSRLPGYDCEAGAGGSRSGARGWRMRFGDFAFIRRAALLGAAALALAACTSDESRHSEGYPPGLAEARLPDEGRRDERDLAHLRPHLQGRIEARDLEAAGHRQVRAAQDLRHLQVVGRARPEGQGGRPPGARGLLHRHPGADEPELQLLPLLQHRLSQQVSTRPTGGPARISWCTAPARRRAAIR